jgi:hypothetical protein
MTIFDIALDHERARAEALNPYGLTKLERSLAELLGEGLGHDESRLRLGLTTEAFDQTYAAIMSKLLAGSDAQLRHVICTLAKAPRQRHEFVYVDDFRTDFSEVRFKSLPADDLVFVK